MGVQKKTRKYAQARQPWHGTIRKRWIYWQSPTNLQMKLAIKKHDERLKNPPAAVPKEKKKEESTRQVAQAPTNMFFAANTALGPPYHVLVDTNFVSHTIRAKLDMLPSMMDLCVIPTAHGW